MSPKYFCVLKERTEKFRDEDGNSFGVRAILTGRNAADAVMFLIKVDGKFDLIRQLTIDQCVSI